MEELRSVVSLACVSSNAFLRLRPFPPRVFVSFDDLSLHTLAYPSASSSSIASYLQWSAILSSATYSAIDFPSFCLRVLKLYLWQATVGVGCK